MLKVIDGNLMTCQGRIRLDHEDLIFFTFYNMIQSPAVVTDWSNVRRNSSQLLYGIKMIQSSAKGKFNAILISGPPNDF